MHGSPSADLHSGKKGGLILRVILHIIGAIFRIYFYNSAMNYEGLDEARIMGIGRASYGGEIMLVLYFVLVLSVYDLRSQCTTAAVASRTPVSTSPTGKESNQLPEPVFLLCTAAQYPS